MKFGVSTASYFSRLYTEDALKRLSQKGTEVSEIFLETYSEYSGTFAQTLLKNKGGTEINSVHTLTTQFEPQLYSKNPRAVSDAFAMLGRVLDVAETVGAKYYTFHGMARVKKTPLVLDYGFIGERTRKIMEACADRNVTLSYENVHWCYYNFPGFFTELKKSCPGLKGVLDVKQAWQSGYSVLDYIDDMKDSIVTFHASDRLENGRMCLAGKGITDFRAIFAKLRSYGFDGAVLIEAYASDYHNEEELFESIEFLKKTALSV